MAEVNDVSWNPDADPRRQPIEVVGPITPKHLPTAPKDSSSSLQAAGPSRDEIAAATKRLTDAIKKSAAVFSESAVKIDGSKLKFTLDQIGADRFFKDDSEPNYETHEMNGRMVRTHKQEYCTGRKCVIHNPSDHPMLGWVRNFRDDTKRTERLCKHGVGHPDPDDVAYWVSQGKAARSLWTHGCDGCCPKSLPVPEV